MLNRDPLSRTSDFIAALTKSPTNALNTVWRGVTEGEDNSFLKYTMPVLGAAGVTLTGIGAVTLDPIDTAMGAGELAYVGGYYYDLGQNVPAPPSPHA